MWVFATPLMLKMYCDVNNMSVTQIDIHYHILPVCVNLAIYPYKYTTYYYVFMGIAYIFYGLFFVSLYKQKDKKFTNIFVTIWLLFFVINTLDLFRLCNLQTIQLFYNVADMIGKVTTNFVIHDYREQELRFMETIDLQCAHFISAMLRHIQNYINENKKLSRPCEKFIAFTREKFIAKIPENRDSLKTELLSKLLPLGMDKVYLTDSNDSNSSKQFNMICVLFTDIVNYTELAKQCDDKTIFDLLNQVYRTFDTVIKKYSHLQKIETIGDAYMVVGDIYRTKDNHIVVIEEMIQLGIEFLEMIKTIETPNQRPLSIRVGINLGKVSIGILGNEIPRLCVVGNAVNVASRLQSTADADSIQMSHHIYEQLCEMATEYDIVKKENVFLKNIGSVTTYTITPLLRPEGVN
jgi:class 3 adenylate cyclase